MYLSQEGRRGKKKKKKKKNEETYLHGVERQCRQWNLQARSGILTGERALTHLLKRRCTAN
jgi:hypothetical protein